MTKYKVTVIHTSGKNEGKDVSFVKKNLESALYIMKEYIEKGDKVTIESITVDNVDFSQIVMEVIKELGNN